jgi:S-adenosylmethionine:tRNA ribosyltransferase-isomerase
MTRTDTHGDLLADYVFDLPESLIAQHPAERRDASRLMTLQPDGETGDKYFSDLPRELRQGDILVRNNAKVLPARLIGKRAGGGRTEILLVRQDFVDGEEAWLCLARPASHLKPGKEVSFGDGEMTARIMKKGAGGQAWVTFSAKGREFRALIEHLGMMPLPPYITRPGQVPSQEDRVRYQTSYASKEGAVAAPTAGLHFTPELDEQIRSLGVEIHEITLYVGPGTFRPIKVDNLVEHRMDAERYEIAPDLWRHLQEAKRQGRRLVAVGTTTSRALESAALAVSQDANEADCLDAWTELFIRPGFEFRMLDGMVTNFHLPGSSLIVMLSAFIGRERILSAYGRAVEKKYRFYSYGDAMLVWKP